MSESSYREGFHDGWFFDGVDVPDTDYERGFVDGKKARNQSEIKKGITMNQQEWAKANKDAADKVRIAAEQDWQEAKQSKPVTTDRQCIDERKPENDNHIHGTGCDQPMGIISYQTADDENPYGVTSPSKLEEVYIGGDNVWN